MSGASNYAYGLLFGASNTDMRRYYDLGISTQGYYIKWINFYGLF